ncbi:MAG: hypothetical protein AAGB51_07810 [Planctomycetota bacterium]
MPREITPDEAAVIGGKVVRNYYGLSDDDAVKVLAWESGYTPSAEASTTADQHGQNVRGKHDENEWPDGEPHDRPAEID